MYGITNGLQAALLVACLSMPAAAAELLMVEQPDCPYCERFNRDIGEAYPHTAEGKRAPLVRLQLHDNWPTQYKGIGNVKLTPTFVLVQDGVEVDRLLGYSGDEHFWFLLGEMLDKL